MRLSGLFSTESYYRPPTNGFIEASAVGKSGVLDLLPLVEYHSYQGRFVLTDKGNISAFLQKTIGDIAFNCKNQMVWGIEVKTERKSTGNFFLELWSNRSRQTQGWMHTLTTDFLWYYFLDSKILHSIYFKKLQEWAFVNGRIERFPLRKQNSYRQLNDTWGALVPITVIENEIGLKKFYKGLDF